MTDDFSADELARIDQAARDAGVLEGRRIIAERELGRHVHVVRHVKGHDCPDCTRGLQGAVVQDLPVRLCARLGRVHINATTGVPELELVATLEALAGLRGGDVIACGLTVGGEPVDG